MSEHGNGAPPPSAAEALYGPDGPVTGGPNFSPQRELIESGIAKRAVSPFAEERPASRPGQGTGPAFDAARVADRNLDPAMVAELGTLGLSQTQGDKLLDLHVRASRAAEEHYSRQLNEGSERLAQELHPQDVATVRELIADPALTPASMKAWVERWGSHPDVAHMLTAWARAIRNGRY
jgi:hypothetical protein